MHKIMEELHQDHIHLARLLRILDEQLVVLKSDGDVDLFFMIDIVDYIQHYPDLVHHPKEDQVYQVLSRQSEEAANMVDSLLDEHESMPSVTIEFRDLLEGAANEGMIVSREDLIDKIQAFVDVQRSHMNEEEQIVFPLIEKTLSDDDWQELEENMQEKHDPLFGSQVEECYENLYQSIKDH